MSAEEKGKKVGKPAASSEKTDDKKGKPPVWRIIEHRGANTVSSKPNCIFSSG